MKKELVIAAEVRDSRGKNEARRLRVRGLIPAVVYGKGGDPIVISVSPKDIMDILRSGTGHNTIFDLAVQDGERAPVMIVDWQFDPVKGNLLHTDLKRIDLSKRIQVSVPVQMQGEPKGVKLQGGLLEVVTREIDIECLPNDIPEHFVLDVTDLNIGDSLRASDVALSGSMVLMSPSDAVVTHVVALRVSEAATEEEPEETAESAAEPEVVKKGKKEEE